MSDTAKRTEFVKASVFKDALAGIINALQAAIRQALAQRDTRMAALEARMTDLEQRLAAAKGLAYRGVYDHGTTYGLGDFVTMHGSVWACRAGKSLVKSDFTFRSLTEAQNAFSAPVGKSGGGIGGGRGATGPTEVAVGAAVAAVGASVGVASGVGGGRLRSHA